MSSRVESCIPSPKLTLIVSQGRPHCEWKGAYQAPDPPPRAKEPCGLLCGLLCYVSRPHAFGLAVQGHFDLGPFDLDKYVQSHFAPLALDWQDKAAFGSLRNLSRIYSLHLFDLWGLLTLVGSEHLR
jgi:hypothetical protein